MRKSKTLAARLSAAMLGGVLLAGIGAGAALAAPAHSTASGASSVSVATRAAALIPAPPPPEHPDASKAYFDFYLYNNTPYEWTLEPGWTHSYVKNGKGEFVDSPWVNGPPPEKIAPRSGISMAKLARSGSQNGQDVWLSYRFTAGMERYMMNLRATDLDQLPSYSMRWEVPQQRWVEDHSVFYTGWQQNAPANSVGGFWRFSAEDCAKMAGDKSAWKGIYRGLMYNEKDPVRLIGAPFYLEVDGSQARATIAFGIWGEDEFEKGGYHIDRDGTFVFNTKVGADVNRSVITMKPTSCTVSGEVTSASAQLTGYITNLTLVSNKPLGKGPLALEPGSARFSLDPPPAAGPATQVPGRTTGAAEE